MKEISPFLEEVQKKIVDFYIMKWRFAKLKLNYLNSIREKWID
jgi:hypothetical protein